MWNWCRQSILWIYGSMALIYRSIIWCKSLIALPEAEVHDKIMCIHFRYHGRKYIYLVPYDRKMLLSPSFYRAGNHHLPHHPSLPLLVDTWKGNKIERMDD